jgi:HAD superfamily hydrolase (TIGR01548 family)
MNKQIEIPINSNPLPEPDGLLFDLDGVLADVRESYRWVIQETAHRFGASVSEQDVTRLKNAPDASNDWILTYRLVVERGIDVAYPDVVDLFQEIYLGKNGQGGAREAESLLVEETLIPILAKSYPLALVTGRPREEAAWFLNRFRLLNYFDVVIGMEDAPAKPDPTPVRRALCRLGVSSAWMLGDSPDDMLAASGAHVTAIGIATPSRSDVLTRTGAARVLRSADQITSLLP